MARPTATSSGRQDQWHPPAVRGLAAESLFLVPRRHLDALRDVLRGGEDPEGVAVELGAAAATEGIGWSELLRDVEDVSRSVSGSLPPYELVRAMSIAWTETAAQDSYVVSCEDPLTGLTSPAHLRTRLDDAYRLAERAGASASDLWAFVVVEVRPSGGAESGLLRSLSMIVVAELLRSCFDGDETVSRLGERRAVALVRRWDATRGYSALRGLVDSSPDVPPTRVWIEGVPGTSEAASRLLGELGRGGSADGLG
ncbi:hypothetical protein KV102_12425 [Mumia sp. zg.B53]|uniref:hypothetical protein n=1 Tax=Mumia sp. zg.B53 TaxID=2855449 RepID=UPI001C6F31BC|nr:hypothetical protein [Mumia sp. zg.B53]MBW9215647.1 hypothetical protein [Mumia sp. zg.B53]